MVALCRWQHRALCLAPGVPGLYMGLVTSHRHSMTKITFITSTGERIETEGENGATVMETAVMNGVPGVVAECGGACTCATCHVYVDDAWTEMVGGPSAMEEDMLDFAFDVKASSRLSCQIKVRDELEGLVVKVPSRQG